MPSLVGGATIAPIMLRNFSLPGNSRRFEAIVRLLSFAAGVLVLSPGFGASAQTSPTRVALETRTDAAFGKAVDAGPLASSQRLTLTLTFASSATQSAALEQYLTELTTSSSPNYRKWLTPVEFATTYGASSTQMSEAKSWAEAHGLTVESVSPSGSRLTISGFTTQIQSTFAVSLHSYKVGTATYFANIAQPSLPAETAALFSAIDGLDNLPATTILSLGSVPTTFATLAELVDSNAKPILALNSGLCPASLSASQLAQYTALFQQAAAQGITTLATRTCAAGSFPSALAEVTAVALAGDAAETARPIVTRPGWQAAPGLPADALRHAPDLTAANAAALAATLGSIAGLMPAGRLGNVNPILYQLAPTPGLYSQSGTWEAATGLGLVDLDKLAKAFPRGSGSSFASFAATNYSPTHGQSTTFSSNVTSGTGGATPTGTVSFVTSTGQTLGTVTLVAGSGSYTSNTLAGGSYTVDAQYSGDGTYAPATSPTGQLYVQPEPSQLSAVVSTGNVVGGTYSVAVTDAAASGVGTPTGNITLMLSGTGTNYTQALTPLGTNSATTTFTVPATTVGTLTLSYNCSGDLSFSCYNAKTTTVTVAKATPGISFSFTPNPVTSGVVATLTATLTAVGTAPIPTGTVTFYDGTTVLNAGTLANGTTTVQGTVPSTSTHTLSAVYNGDPNYNTVSSNGGTTGAMPTPTVSLSSSNTMPAAGATVTFTAGVAGPAGSATPTGSVTFVDSVSGTLGSAALVNGVATFGATTLPSGPSTVVANYGGSASFNAASSAPVTETPTSNGNEGTTTVLSISPNSVTSGQTVTFSAVVTAKATVNNASPTGTVTFQAATQGVIATNVSVVNGVATFTPSTALPAGSYSVTATYSGDKNYAASTSSSVALTVAAASGTGTLTASLTPSTAAPGTTANVTATITLPSGTPSGVVLATLGYPVGGTTNYSGTIVATGATTGTVTIPISVPPAGSYTVYVGCPTSDAFACNTVTLTLTSTGVSGGGVLTATLSPSTALPASTATVTGALTLPTGVPSGTVLATLNYPTGGTTNYAGTLIATTGTTATFSIPVVVPPIGTYSLSIGCPTSDTFTCNTVTLPLTSSATALIATTTTLTISPVAPTAGTAVTFTATVASAMTGAAAISGTVSFYNGTTLIGSAPVTAGVATTIITLSGTGTGVLTAQYSGDTIYAPSVSPASDNHTEPGAERGDVEREFFKRDCRREHYADGTGFGHRDCGHFAERIGELLCERHDSTVAWHGNARVQRCWARGCVVEHHGDSGRDADGVCGLLGR